MTRWTDPEPDGRPPKRNLVTDLMSLGPASTPAREVLATALLIGMVFLLMFVVFPDRFSGNSRWIVGAIVVGYCGLRVSVGIPKWRSR